MLTWALLIYCKIVVCLCQQKSTDLSRAFTEKNRVVVDVPREPAIGAGVFLALR
jgi:hypothetical protein